MYFFCSFEYGLNSRRFSTKPKGLLIKLKDDVGKKCGHLLNNKHSGFTLTMRYYRQRGVGHITK